MDTTETSSGTRGYRRPRYSDHGSRREAFEQRFGRRGLEEKKEIDPRYSQPPDHDHDEPDPASDRDFGSPTPIQQLNPCTNKHDSPETLRESKYEALSDVLGRVTLLSPDANDDCASEQFPIPARPLHDPLSNRDHDQIKYYRIKFKGFANIISQPHFAAPRTGTYLGYGEVFSSLMETTVHAQTGRRLYTMSQHSLHQDDDEQKDDSTRGRSEKETREEETQSNAEHEAPSNLPRPMYKFIRVDSVLTGGYAMDSHNTEQVNAVDDDSKTPRRSNMQQHTPLKVIGPMSSPAPWVDDAAEASSQHYGYLLAQQDDNDIVEELHTTPISEAGRFMYVIMSSSPLPILTGPSFDAPRTKAVLLPGTVHEVSLRISLDPENEGIFFLRLSHRRGWIADRKVARNLGQQYGTQSVPVVKEIPGQMHCGDASIASLSLGSSVAISSVSAATSSSAMARMRHRPPRRHRINVKESIDTSLPRHIVNSGSDKHTPVSTPVKAGRNDESLVMSPASNVSMISDDASFDQDNSESAPQTISNIALQKPATSHRISSSKERYFLMQVTAPRGLKVLDAPQTQVNTLLHGKQGGKVSSSHAVTKTEGPKSHQSIFQTMSGRLTTTGPSMSSNVAVFDAALKTRILPHGALFEASRRMESSGAYSQGAGLIKLSDNSGWAIVPQAEELEAQYRLVSGPGMEGHEGKRAFAQVGSAVIEDSVDSGAWLRVHARNGVQVMCPPPVPPMSPEDNETASLSSTHSSSVNPESTNGQISSKDSDVSSSVGSSFLDAMFRTPTKHVSRTNNMHDSSLPQQRSRSDLEPYNGSHMIACGMAVEIDPPLEPQQEPLYVRLRGGQGWIPLSVGGKNVSMRVPPPETRLGSFWFRVQSTGGIKVRLGPSKRAPSIKSEDGVFFRFECGEFLRASEVVSFFSDDGKPVECFAKLYRNRHLRLHDQEHEYRSFASLTVQSEWVHVHGEDELFLEECTLEPRIERHRQGWRYTALSREGVAVHRGPTFSAAKTGAIVPETETVAITERVRPAGERVTWLRMKDGSGWIHDMSEKGEQVMAPHTLTVNQRVDFPGGAPVKRRSTDKREIAYNTIVARLFHSDGAEASFRNSKDSKGRSIQFS